MLEILLGALIMLVGVNVGYNMRHSSEKENING